MDTMTHEYKVGDKVRILDNGDDQGKVRHYLEAGTVAEVVGVDPTVEVGRNSPFGYPSVMLQGRRAGSGDEGGVIQRVSTASVEPEVVGRAYLDGLGWVTRGTEVRYVGDHQKLLGDGEELTPDVPLFVGPSPYDTDGGWVDLDGEVRVYLSREDAVADLDTLDAAARRSYVKPSELKLPDVGEVVEAHRDELRRAWTELAMVKVERDGAKRELAEQDEARAALEQARAEVEELQGQRDRALTMAANLSHRLDIEPTGGAILGLLRSIPGLPDVDNIGNGNDHDDDGDATLTLAFPGHRWEHGRLVPKLSTYMVHVEQTVTVTLFVEVEATDEDGAHDRAYDQARATDLAVRVDRDPGDVTLEDWATVDTSVESVEDIGPCLEL